jgi:hypothetical protein
LNFVDSDGNIGASLQANGTFVISDLQIAKQTSDFVLSKLKLDSLEVSGEINGNLIKDNPNYSLVITDENDNIGYYVDLNGVASEALQKESGYLADVN